MAENQPCKICGDEEARTAPDTFINIKRIYQCCPLCGKFWWGDSTPPLPQENRQETQVKLSAWIREQNRLSEIPEIDGYLIKRIVAMPFPSPLERADRLLIHLVYHQGSLDAVIICRNRKFRAISYSKNLGELDYLVKCLVDQGFLFVDQGFLSEDLIGCKITPQGYKRYKELNAREADST